MLHLCKMWQKIIWLFGEKSVEAMRPTKITANQFVKAAGEADYHTIKTALDDTPQLIFREDMVMLDGGA